MPRKRYKKNVAEFVISVCVLYKFSTHHKFDSAGTHAELNDLIQVYTYTKHEAQPMYGEFNFTGVSLHFQCKFQALAL